MDEPFSALDAPTRQSLQDESTRIWRETGKTILFVTHDIDEAVYLATRVVALGGKPGEIKASLAINTPHPRNRQGPALNDYAVRVKAGLMAEAALDDWTI
jgi:NitT/TauT family transport system ATP-binding protein